MAFQKSGGGVDARAARDKAKDSWDRAGKIKPRNDKPRK